MYSTSTARKSALILFATAPISSSEKNTTGNSIRLGNCSVTTSPRLHALTAQELGKALHLRPQLAVGDAPARVDHRLAIRRFTRAPLEHLGKGLGLSTNP